MVPEKSAMSTEPFSSVHSGTHLESGGTANVEFVTLIGSVLDFHAARPFNSEVASVSSCKAAGNRNQPSERAAGKRSHRNTRIEEQNRNPPGNQKRTRQALLRLRQATVRM
mmetsp:Transcript_105930/g.304418  ORF Transcript_105930/g.304418 Transcript_105930/m.304418 type:complete len:111 (+) Transcript_105930:399-731(+)